MADALPHLATSTDAQRLRQQQQAQADLEVTLIKSDRELRAATRKIRALERAIARLLTDAHLPAATRAALVGLLAGSRSQENTAAAVAVLTPSEQDLVANYRAMGQGAKSAVTLLAKAAAKSGD